MKKIVLFILFYHLLIFAQQFHSLDGIEDSEGNTLLFYRLGSQYSYFNPVYKMNMKTGYEKMIMDAYDNMYPGSELAKAVLDYEFFPNDTANFVNCGYMIYPDNHGYIARNDSGVLGGISNFELIEVSKQNPNKVFVADYYLTYESSDAGLTYTYYPDSILQFPLVSVASFDDKTFFGVDEEYNLIKSINGGLTNVKVDNSIVFRFENLKFLYDINKYHVYRTNKDLDGYSFHVSNNKGDSLTWIKTYESIIPLFISIDSSQSGVVYLADGRAIYKSTNNGYTFELNKSLISNVNGLYKKPNSSKLYASTKGQILEISPDSIKIIKSLPNSENVFDWFPLAVGNKWIYSSYSVEYVSGYTPRRDFLGTKIMEVQKDTVINNKTYFVIVNDLLNQFVFDEKLFLRVDSATGYMYKFWMELNNEFIFHNLNDEVGDIIFHPLNSSETYYRLTNEWEIQFFGQTTIIREYLEHCLGGCRHNLIKGFGLSYANFDEFGGFEDNLNGCILNGVVYGDTTFIVGIQDKNQLVPTEFRLFQNYPNPFNPSTKIRYAVPLSGGDKSLSASGGGGSITLKVYDVLGNEIATLVNEYKPAGSYEVEFSAKAGLPSGVYIYTLRAGDYFSSRKMILLK